MLSRLRAWQLVSAFKCGFKDQFSKPHPQSKTYMVTTYHLEKNIVQRQGEQLKGEFDRVCKLRDSTLTKIFPIPHNTGHYCKRQKHKKPTCLSEASCLLRSTEWRRAGRLLQEVPAPRMNSGLSQLLSPLPALLAMGPAAL